jgi:hypothetical protein
MQNQDIAQSLAAANAPPVRTNIRPGPPRGSYDAPMGMGGSPLGYANITLPPTMGPINPPIFGAHTPPNKSGGAYNISTPVTLGDILNTPAQYSTGLAREKNVNSTVYDTLVQITGEKLGSNLGNWRRWWTNQQNNRALQKTKTVEPVISKSSNSSDVPRPR